MNQLRVFQNGCLFCGLKRTKRKTIILGGPPQLVEPALVGPKGNQPFGPEVWEPLAGFFDQQNPPTVEKKDP